ncbi:MAG: hypothetical protein ACTHLE_06885 [Agriterribacter sp.]
MNDNQGKQNNDITALKEMFNAHKLIFNSYTNVRVPKQLLKDMMRDLQEYYNQINNNNNEQQQQALS